VIVAPANLGCFYYAAIVKMSARSTEMSWQIESMSEQTAFLPAENTKMSA
jgi:hypothetical protein